MPDPIDSFPLLADPPEAILARMLADTNAGIDPADPLFADTASGGMWDDMHRCVALELDRLNDRIVSELPAASLPLLATGVWLDLWAESLGLERNAATLAAGVVTFTGDPGTIINTGTQVSTEAPSADSDPVGFATTAGGTIGGGGTLDLPMQATAVGSAGNVAVNTVTVLGSITGAISAITNAAAVTGGSDIETDERLQARIVKKLRSATGPGNIAYYENYVLNTPGVGFVTVLPNIPALGQVAIIVRDINNDPMPSGAVAALQEALDPSSGPAQGLGAGAIGAAITVSTPTPEAIAIAATIVLEVGYSINGSGGTRAVQGDVNASVDAYGLTLGPGSEIIHNKVLAAIIDVTGIDDVTALTINGVGGNVAIDDAHVPEFTMPVVLT